MSLPRYEGYKDSGVEWLGEVPEHWDIMSLKRICDVRDGTHDTPTFVDETEQTFPLVTSKDIVNGLLNLTDTKHISEADYISIAKRSEVVHGDILMPMIGSIGGAVIVNSDKNFAIKNIALFKQGSDFTSCWLMHLLNSKLAIIQFELERSGGVQGFISLGTLRNLRFPIPNKTEQLKIANFLDQETAKIDNLIAEQQQLIELLKEKRQAVISHTVTKGLNPNVPIKDSGIEWLGKVPEHWDVCVLRRVLQEHKQGYYTNAPYVDIGVKLLRITDIRPYGQIDSIDCPLVEINDDLSSFLLKESDFVFARTGGAGTFGLIENINEPIVFASYLIRFRFKDTVKSNFLRYFFLSDIFQKGIKQNIHGGVNQNIHAEDIKNQYMALPKPDEQEKIFHFLNQETSKIDNLSSEANDVIELLKERRSALISSAVTGKIDVRNKTEMERVNA